MRTTTIKLVPLGHCHYVGEFTMYHLSHPDKIMIDWEHTECKWIKPGDLSGYTTVPGLDRALRSVIRR